MNEATPISPDQALKQIEARYFEYQAAQARWEAGVDPRAVGQGYSVGPGAGNYPAWMDSQRRLDRLLELLESLFKARERVAQAILPASRESKDHL